ncbi:hypothetical protein AALP_AA1G306000, partial [Arabis alpina]
KASDFTTSFTFKIDTRNLTTFGHGIAFFLAPAGIVVPPNSASGFLGLFNETNGHSSRYPLVHVEFDTFYNLEWDPLDIKSHVGINNNSLSSSNYTSWNASSHSQDTGHARISYDAARRNLSVSWTYEKTSDPRESSSLFYIIDLTKVLPAEVTMGFSGATGANMEAHRILSWEFDSNLDVIEKRSPNRRGIIVGASLSAFVLLASLFVMVPLFLKRKQRKEKADKREHLTSINGDDLERGAGPRRFSYKDLASATNNFLFERKLGEGGFGAVYKGYLNEFDLMVAVKKFSGGASKQGKKEFITEVKIISSLRHRNLVQLIGWCHEKEELLLVYEFMPNGSLDSHIFGKKTHLPWSIRYKISLGVASALLYLHEEWEQCIIHRDIKASNIMLDSNFNVKLGDFGLARLMDHELGPQTTGLAGTFGYMAPEYISTGRASKESDVYSFGVVLVEIVTGKKSRYGKIELEATLVEKVWDLYGKGELISAIDPQMGENYDMKQAECLIIVGLWCAHPDINHRPSIKQAIQVLNFEAPLPTLPSKMPVATYHAATSTSSNSSGVATATFSSAKLGR